MLKHFALRGQILNVHALIYGVCTCMCLYTRDIVHMRYDFLSGYGLQSLKPTLSHRSVPQLEIQGRSRVTWNLVKKWHYKWWSCP